MLSTFMFLEVFVTFLQIENTERSGTPSLTVEFFWDTLLTINNRTHSVMESINVVIDDHDFKPVQDDDRDSMLMSLYVTRVVVGRKNG